MFVSFRSNQLAPYVEALAMAWDYKLVSPYRQPVKELKVQNMNKSPPKYFQPEPQHNSEKKADNLFVCHAIANALVVCSCHSSPEIIIDS